MHDPLDAVLRYIVVVEQGVSDARDAAEQNAGCGEEEGAEVGSLGGLGDGGVDGEEGCFLDCLVVIFWVEEMESYESSGDEAGAPSWLRILHQL